MKYRLLLILLVAALFTRAYPHSGNPAYHVIIDTDGALDDMRAITMLLSCNDVRVLAITCSDGTLRADSTMVKVKALLAAFHHEGIPVGVSKGTDAALPAWSSFMQSVHWGNTQEGADGGQGGIPGFPVLDAQYLMDQVTDGYRQKITLVALGSLATFASWMDAASEKQEKIDRIIWYNASPMEEGFNYQAAPKGFDFLERTGIGIHIVSGPAGGLPVSTEYVSLMENSASPYAQHLAHIHQSSSVHEKVRQQQLYLLEDLVPLYLTVPVLFDVRHEQQITFVNPVAHLPSSLIYEVIRELLASSIQPDNKVFSAFPVGKELYLPAYKSMLPGTIDAFGMIEWKAIVLTNEIHGHTGIYSIIGAKMGIRAMEYFNVGVNNLVVESFAGDAPPLSCFNDGIQISTGATIGQGLIHVSDSVSAVPSAVFQCNQLKVHISVREELAERMEQEIAYGERTYGILTDAYWLYIERLAQTYWAELDRNEIFRISITDNATKQRKL
jgi:pyrimidine-specific ribonucleoside hydrolase